MTFMPEKVSKRFGRHLGEVARLGILRNFAWLCNTHQAKKWVKTGLLFLLSLREV